MSRLQTFLHALPPGSIVTKEMQKSNKELSDQLKAEGQAEVLQAKQIQRETGCSWSDAIEEVVRPREKS